MEKIILLVFILISSVAQSQDFVAKMYTANAKDFRKSLSFVQQTEFYRNDSLMRTATWHEVLVYPDKLRIDINDVSKGNSLFFVNDSFYNFQNSELKSRSYQPHDLLFVLGGMYSFSLDAVLKRLKAIGYNTDKSFEAMWKGIKVVVVGTDKEETESNQFWVDKEKLVTVRILNNKDGQKTEIRCEDYIRLGNNWCETKIEMYINGKLRQTEKYTNVQKDIIVDMEYFNPYKFGQVKFWN
jgi:hypothetical protein